MNQTILLPTKRLDICRSYATERQIPTTNAYSNRPDLSQDHQRKSTTPEDSSIIRTRETRTTWIIMNRLPRHPKAQPTERNPNPNNQQIENSQGDLPPRRKVPAPIHK